MQFLNTICLLDSHFVSKDNSKAGDMTYLSFLEFSSEVYTGAMKKLQGSKANIEPFDQGRLFNSGTKRSKYFFPSP